MENQQLNFFLSVIKDTHIFGNSSSGLVLIEQLLKYSTSLILEIEENYLILPTEKGSLYLDFVRKKILNADFDEKLDIKSVDVILRRYDATFKDIESFNIHQSKIEPFLAENYNKVSRYYRDEAYDCQRKLVDYYTTLSVNKVLACCDSINKNSVENYTYNTSVFLSFPAYSWFQQTLLGSGRLDSSNTAKRGFQGIANAIFCNKNCKEHIFKHSVFLKEYIEFLNSTYKVNIKGNKQLSSGSIHESYVESEFSKYLK